MYDKYIGMSTNESGTPVSDSVHRIFADRAVDDVSNMADFI